MATTIGELNEPLRLLVRGFLKRYPAAEPQDVYCLIHDGTCGYRQDLTRVPSAASLQSDAASAGSTGETFESASVHGSLLRVHVAPYLAAGGDLGALHAAAVSAASEWEPRRDLLFTLWAGFVHMNRRHEFRLNRDALDHFEMRVASSGYPAVDPSAAFVATYQPVYVLVGKERAAGLKAALAAAPPATP